MTDRVKRPTLGRPSRRQVLASAGGAAVAVTGFPYVSVAQNKPIKIGMPTILSGRVAQLGVSSRNAAQLEVDKFNAAGGLGGRPIELIVRDSKGKPEEAASVSRAMINTDGCDFLIDAEASGASFAVQEVVRDLKVFCVHTCSETTSLTADPKIRLPTVARTARIGIHDAIVSGAYAGGVAKANGLKTWMSCSPDYAYGRDNTNLFLEYLKRFNPDVEVIGETWPKLFQADYTENVTKILQTKPQAVYSALWGGDLTSFIDQSSIYNLFGQTTLFGINMADYTTLTAVKNLPAGIHSATRYIKTYPATPDNAAWADAYQAKFKDLPTNWSWENAVAMQLVIQAMQKTNSSDGAKLAEAVRGMTLKSPFGADGTVKIRESDGQLINYAIGWGQTIQKDPYVKDVTGGDWKTILELEAEWMKKMNFA